MPARRHRRAAAAAPSQLGLDIGGVIVRKSTGNEDTSFLGSRPMDTPAVPGAVAAITAMNAGRFAGRIHLVSKAGPKVATITRDWLAATGFHTTTGVGPERLHFVRERSEKAGVCRELGITHFVDDMESVLNQLPDVKWRYLFVGGPVAQRATPTDRALILVPDWPTLRLRLDRDWPDQ